MVTLCRAADVASRAQAQAAFERWLRVALLSFGRPGSRASERAIALGLKRDDPATVMCDFVADVRAAVWDAGLQFPAPASLGLELPARLAQALLQHRCL